MLQAKLISVRVVVVAVALLWDPDKDLVMARNPLPRTRMLHLCLRLSSHPHLLWTPSHLLVPKLSLPPPQSQCHRYLLRLSISLPLVAAPTTAHPPETSTTEDLQVRTVMGTTVVVHTLTITLVLRTSNRMTTFGDLQPLEETSTHQQHHLPAS